MVHGGRERETDALYHTGFLEVGDIGRGMVGTRKEQTQKRATGPPRTLTYFIALHTAGHGPGLGEGRGLGEK